MGRKRLGRSFGVVERYATDPDAPDLTKVQAEAAPIVAQLLAQVLRKRMQQKETPERSEFGDFISVQALSQRSLAV